MTPMSVRYSRALAIVELVVGVLLFLVALAGPQVIGVVAGVILTVLGVLMLVNPMLRIQTDEVQVRNLLGITLKRFPVSSPADLRIEGNALHHVADGKKIVSLGFGVHKGDVAELRAQLSGQAV